MTQSEFDLICEHHQLWLKGTSFGARAEFAGRTIEGINASDRDLSGAIFTNARVFSCNLTNTNLTDIIAANTHFHDTDFTGANLRGAYMPRAEFTQSIFSKTDLWNVTGDGVYIISLQLGGHHVVYTSEILQINCLRFGIKEIWWMPNDEVLSWVEEHSDEYKAEIAKWWQTWKLQIYQIVTTCPAKPVNNC